MQFLKFRSFNWYLLFTKSVIVSRFEKYYKNLFPYNTNVLLNPLEAFTAVHTK